MFDWSDQQKAIFSAGVRGSKHIIVFALAGTAKTTTAVELVDRYRNDQLTGHHTVLLCAYNNRIRDELAERIALQEKRSAVLGVHQAGFALLRGAFRGITLDEDKGKKCAARACIEAGYTDRKYIERADLQWRLRVQKLATLAKYTLAQSESDLVAITNRFELVDERHPAEPMIEMAKVALRLAVTDTDSCDFDDQIWMPIQYNIHPRSPFDLVIGDEVQDWANAELWIMQRMLAPNGRMILFGDPNQSVYDWKGADVDAMGRMKSILESTPRGCEVLKLTTTYRCPKAVVREASKIVREYTAAPNAPEGVVRRTNVSKMIQDVQPGDVIISRLKAPLSSMCLSLIRARKPSYVVGRDYGDVMLGLIDKSGATTPDELEAWAMSRAVTEYEKLMAQDQDEKAANVFDEYDTLCGLAKMSKSIADLRSTIDRLFRDKAPFNAITCTTLHKAKGLEWDRVFLLAQTFKRDKPAEERILYVAMTRSKRELVYVWPDPKPTPRIGAPTTGVKPVSRNEAAWQAYYDIDVNMKAKEEG